MKDNNENNKLTREELENTIVDNELYLLEQKTKREQPTTGAISLRIDGGETLEKFAPAEAKTTTLLLESRPSNIIVYHSTQDGSAAYPINVLEIPTKGKDCKFTVDLSDGRQLSLYLKKVKDVSEDVDSYQLTAKMSLEHQKETSMLNKVFSPLRNHGYRIPGM